jgi:hypothetical protein
MRAARLHYFSDFDGVVGEDIEPPIHASGEVLVRVEVTSLHPTSKRCVNFAKSAQLVCGLYDFTP